MAGFDVDITGDKRVKAVVQRFAETGADCVVDEINAAAVNIQKRAKEACPVDTGRLRSSIRPVFAKQGGSVIGARVFTEVEYAPFVEFGTLRMRAQPFMLPAYNEEIPKLVRRLRDCLGPGGRAIKAAQ